MQGLVLQIPHWPKLRDPLRLAALVFLVASLMLSSIPEPRPEPTTSIEQADQKAREVAYGVRNGDDAVRLTKEGSDEAPGCALWCLVGLLG